MKKIIKLSVIIVAVLMLNSCEGFLNKAPLLDQSTELSLGTYAGLNKSMAGAYTYLADGTWYGAGYVLEGEMRSGNGYKPTEGKFDSGRYANPYFISYSPSSTSGLYQYGYRTIAAANNIIENIDGKEGPDVTPQDINNVKAEALFLRALAHFDMVRLYAQPYTSAPESDGIPYVFITDPAGFPARDQVRVVFTNIVADLLEAESLMADSYKRTGTDAKAYATKPAIQALLSRAYLYMGEWQKCADYSTKVINNSDFKMWTPADLVDAKAYRNNIPTTGEIIFEMYMAQTNEFDEYWENASWLTDPDGYADVGASHQLYDLYEDGDVRKEELFRSHKDGPDLLWTKKYAGKGNPVPDVNNVVILRLSEMYLNRAEAILNGASAGAATVLSDLNVITSNRDASPYTSAGSLDVFTERRKELAFEGHLWFDYPRTKRAMDRGSEYYGATNRSIPFPSYMWALPLPKSQLDVNENLVQNPGW